MYLPRCSYGFHEFLSPPLHHSSISLSSPSRPLMTITSDTRKPYGGSTRSLVLAFDVGTTFSGVSYAILEPNEIPKIHGVTRCVLLSHPWPLPTHITPLSSFPGQEHVAGSYKIPTILYYDKNGDMK